MWKDELPPPPRPCPGVEDGERPLGYGCAGEQAGICSGGPAHHPECPDFRPRPRNTVTLEFDPPADPRWPTDPPAWWLEAWAAGWMAGHATGFEHGVDAGYAEYGAVLADALKPMRRAAAHGIDVALARRAWENHRVRGGDQDA